MKTRVIKVGSDSQALKAAQQGAKALQEGKLVGFATETVYGIAAVASNLQTMERLRELKSRPARPFSVHMGSADDVKRYVKKIPAAASRLMAKSWPGPITVLLETGGTLAEKKLQKEGLSEVLCSDGIIGLRCPDEFVSQKMLSAVASPVVAPSANLAGEPSPRNAQEVLGSLDGKIDLLIDSGPTKYGNDSTIVKFSSSGFKVLRQGVFDEKKIRELTKWKFLFVCTGNTCRSPMAGGLAKKLIAEKLGCRLSDLKRKGIEVESAGIFTGDGARATPEAVAAAGMLGVNISRHRSQKLTAELINSSDFVFCMSEFHVDQASRLSISHPDKIMRLDSRGDIPDPIGGSQDIYHRTAQRIEKAIKRHLDKVEL